MATSTSAVGRLLPAISSLLRPPPAGELREYGGVALVRRKRVIDIGCGDGRMALGCAPYASEVVGVDPDPSAIRLARAFTGRDKVVKIEGSYHGHHDTVMMSTKPAAELGLNQSQAFFDLRLAIALHRRQTFGL